MQVEIDKLTIRAITHIIEYMWHNEAKHCVETFDDLSEEEYEKLLEEANENQPHDIFGYVAYDVLRKLVNEKGGPSDPDHIFFHLQVLNEFYRHIKEKYELPDGHLEPQVEDEVLYVS